MCLPHVPAAIRMGPTLVTSAMITSFHQSPSKPPLLEQMATILGRHNGQLPAQVLSSRRSHRPLDISSRDLALTFEKTRPIYLVRGPMSSRLSIADMWGVRETCCHHRAPEVASVEGTLGGEKRHTLGVCSHLSRQRFAVGLVRIDLGRVPVEVPLFWGMELSGLIVTWRM